MGSPPRLTCGKVRESLFRVPDTVFLLTGHGRGPCSEAGMTGFRVELDSSNEYCWIDSRLTFLDSDELRLHLSLSKERVESSLSGNVLLSLSQSTDYVGRFESYTKIVQLWRDNKSLRLGRRCYLPIWELTQAELGLISISPREFRRDYQADPRGRLSFSEVLRREYRHAPMCVGTPAPLYQRGPLVKRPVLIEPSSMRSRLSAPSKPRLKDKRGMPLSSKARLLNRVTALFYSIPQEGRSAKIPYWYSEVLNKPRYLFRIKGRDMSLQQKVVSTLCRVYHWYRFTSTVRTVGTAKLIKFSRGDNIYRVLSHPMGPDWYTMAAIAYRRLKVLLSPLWA